MEKINIVPKEALITQGLLPCIEHQSTSAGTCFGYSNVQYLGKGPSINFLEYANIRGLRNCVFTQ